MPHIKIQHLPSTKNFTTDVGVNIHSNVQNGKTKIFRSRNEAEEYAKNNRRCSYPVFEDGSTNGFYAVPN